MNENKELEIKCKYCDSISVIRFGTQKNKQQYFCRNCQRKFNLNDTLTMMKTPVPVIASALSQYYNGSSLDGIVENIKQQYGIQVTDAGVYNWIERFSKEAIEKTKDIHPKVGDVWVADETVIKINGHNVWHFDIIDSKTRYVLATYVSHTRTIKDVQKLLEKASARANKIPKTVVSDKLASYIDGVELTFGKETKHIATKPFEEGNENNLIERWHGTLKDRLKVMRGMGKSETAQILLDGFLFYYNYLRPHESLDNKTPAEVAKVESPYKDWTDVVRKSQDTVPKITEKEEYRKAMLAAGIKLLPEPESSRQPLPELPVRSNIKHKRTIRSRSIEPKVIRIRR